MLFFMRSFMFLNIFSDVVGQLPTSMYCSFSQGSLCGLLQDRQDQTDWSVSTGPTATLNTGPHCDLHDCSNGYYLYLESSTPVLPGDRARIKTPVMAGESTMCLSFLYHMYGESMGSLAVSMAEVVSGTELPLWAVAGNQSNVWHQKYIQFNPTGSFEVWFDATKGSSYYSDIAIDNLSVTPGTCSRFNCTFDHDFCDWTNSDSPLHQRKWTRHQGSTASKRTGPAGDRLSPTDGQYIYVESSRTKANDTARLISPTLPATTASCLTFWRHMYGHGTGTLEVSLQLDGGQSRTMWTQSGDQGDQWLLTNVNLDSSTEYKISIQVILAGGPYGDIAIDSVSLSPGLCGGHST